MLNEGEQQDHREEYADDTLHYAYDGACAVISVVDEVVTAPDSMRPGTVVLVVLDGPVETEDEHPEQQIEDGEHHAPYEHPLERAHLHLE